MGAARGCVAPAAAGLLSDTVAMDKGRATRGLESSLGDNIASSVGWPDRYIGEYFLDARMGSGAERSFFYQ
jgi:hypothetical protein